MSHSYAVLLKKKLRGMMTRQIDGIPMSLIFRGNLVHVRLIKAAIKKLFQAE